MEKCAGNRLFKRHYHFINSIYWMSTKKILVSSLLYSGLQNPRWAITKETNVEILKKFLKDLPLTTKPTWPLFGWRGFLLVNQMVEGFPEEVRVFQGVIRIVEGGTQRFFEDIRGLEYWLKKQTRSHF